VVVAKLRRRNSSSMIWRKCVTEIFSSATQTSSDHLDRWLSNTRTRPPQRGLVQVGLSEVMSQTRHSRYFGRRKASRPFSAQMMNDKGRLLPRAIFPDYSIPKFCHRQSTEWLSVANHVLVTS